MKSLAELKKIREEAANKINLRTAKDGYRVVVGMATCGITAGARPVLAAFVDQVAAKHVEDVEQIIEQHIIGGKVITEKTLEAIKAAK